MDYDEDIKKLEGNVERLLGSLDSAQEERSRLRADVARLEAARKGLEDEVKRLKEEKKAIHQRVSALILSIEKWEKASPADEDRSSVLTGPVAGTGKGADPVQGVLVGS